MRSRSTITMRLTLHILFFVCAPFVVAGENAQQLVQNNVNLQNVEQNSLNQPQVPQDSSSSSLNAQQVHQQQQQQQQVRQDSSVVAGSVVNHQTEYQVPPYNPNSIPSQQQQQSPQPQPQPQIPSQAQSQPQSQPQSLTNDVQLLKEANAQYQYQINSRYEEKTRPVFGRENINSQYPQPSHLYGNGMSGYPNYRENTQYQESGNGQRRADTTLVINDGLKSQYENQDHTSYTQQRSRSFSEYGKGEVSPDYNTYAYKRTYY